MCAGAERATRSGPGGAARRGDAAPSRRGPGVRDGSARQCCGAGDGPLSGGSRRRTAREWAGSETAPHAAFEGRWRLWPPPRHTRPRTTSARTAGNAGFTQTARTGPAAQEHALRSCAAADSRRHLGCCGRGRSDAPPAPPPPPAPPSHGPVTSRTLPGRRRRRRSFRASPPPRGPRDATRGTLGSAERQGLLSRSRAVLAVPRCRCRQPRQTGA